MSSRENERAVRLSVIDRLIDRDPRIAGDPPIAFSESVRRHKAALLRDLEWLLNTRRTPEPAGSTHAETQRSVFNYGLPDTTSLSGDDPAVRRKLQREIEECLRQFEPRLTDIEVTLAESTNPARRQVRFVVEAILRMDPDPERIVFDTVLDVGSGAISVAGDGHA